MADQPDIPVLRLLDDLRDGLIEANRLFQVGENDGREGAIQRKSVIKFLMQIPQIGDQGLIAPLAPLFDALINLDDGHTQPILKAVRKSGRARAGAITSISHWRCRLYCRANAGRRHVARSGLRGDREGPQSFRGCRVTR